ncbi:phage terminase large subunit family protein, partial [Vibrio vulnificus]
FARGAKRTLQSGSDGICIAEASPSRIPVKDQEGLKPHQAPRAGGITGLYNEGSCEVWYWNCPNCDKWYPVKWELLTWDDKDEHSVRANCPHCSHEMQPTDKYE